MKLPRLRIVLDRPTGPANIGAVCRVMKNLGLSDLVLVAPKHPLDHPEAVAYSTHGHDVLESARVVDTLGDALAGSVRTFATSAKLGLYRRQSALAPATAAAEAIRLTSSGVVALAFGTESTGFDVEQLLEFDRVITIPNDETYPVMNLAAAVTVVAYEFRCAALNQSGAAPLPMAIRDDLAPDERKRVLYDALFAALDRIGFFHEQCPKKLRFALRHVFGRIDLTINEVDVLIGMARQIHWKADHPSPPEDG
jgi:tRNA/rRNA methyltransferase